MKKSNLVWLIIFIIGASVRGTYLFQPVNTKSWREADVSTIAKNFYQNGTDIFHPQINYGGTARLCRIGISNLSLPYSRMLQNFWILGTYWTDNLFSNFTGNNAGFFQIMQIFT